MVSTLYQHGYASCFFKLAEVLPLETAVAKLKEAIVKDYGHKGDDIVNIDYAAVDAGMDATHEVDYPAEWANLTEEANHSIEAHPSSSTRFSFPLTRQKVMTFPSAPSSAWKDGTFMSVTSRYEKRGIAVSIPQWKIENCINVTNVPSYACYAVIRPFLLDEESN